MTVTQSRATERKDDRPLPGHRVRLGTDRPLRLGCGAELHDFPVPYQTYGSLNRDTSNAIPVCPAPTAVHVLADAHPVTVIPRAWALLVGPGQGQTQGEGSVPAHGRVAQGNVAVGFFADVDPMTATPARNHHCVAPERRECLKHICCLEHRSSTKKMLWNASF